MKPFSWSIFLGFLHYLLVTNPVVANNSITPVENASVPLVDENDKTKEPNSSTALDPVISVKEPGGNYLFYLACKGKKLEKLYFLPCDHTQECNQFAECLVGGPEHCRWYDTIWNTVIKGRECFGFVHGECLNVVPRRPNPGLAICLSKERAVINFVLQQLGPRKKWTVFVGSEILPWRKGRQIDLNGNAIRPFSNVIANKTVTQPVITCSNFHVHFQVGQEGQSLSCQYIGEPSTKIVWLHNGTDISELAKNVIDWPFASSYLHLGIVRAFTAGNYTLIASNRFGTDKVHLNVTTFYIDPIIHDKSAKNDRVTFTMENQTLSCKFKGSPRPHVVWYHENKPLEKNRAVELELGENYNFESRLSLPNITTEDAGSYKCLVTSDLLNKSDELTFNVKVMDGGEVWNDELLYGLVASGLILLSILAIVFTLIRRYYAFSENRELKSLDKEFHEGQPEKIAEEDQENTFNAKSEEYCCKQNRQNVHDAENFIFLPFNTEHIISKKERKKGARIGKGEYGYVFKGQFREELVAIKEPKENTSIEVFRLFLKELKLVSQLGDHENILRFIGAVTEGIREKKLEIVFEFCESGDLGSFILTHKNSFEKIVHSCNDGSRKKKLLFWLFVTWCEQICNGMTYLEDNKIVHMDLAVRNVLVYSPARVKISDFGLSRKLYKNLYQMTKEKHAKIKVPWKYWAHESLNSGHFTTQSDVWTFGVTAWEIYSMGGEPFSIHPELTTTFRVNVGQEPNYTLQKPDFCPVEIYEKLKSCWRVLPEKRPKFGDLKSFFQQLGQGPITPENFDIDWLSSTAMDCEDINLIADDKSSSAASCSTSTSTSTSSSSSPAGAAVKKDDTSATPHSPDSGLLQSTDTVFELSSEEADDLVQELQETTAIFPYYEPFDTVVTSLQND